MDDGIEADIHTVLALRHKNGGDFWATEDRRIAVGSPFSTLESLVTLHELGIDPGHEAAAGALGLVLGGWRDDGRFRLAPKGAIYPCHTANAARVLCRYGLAADPQLQATFAHLLETPFVDGGWRCNKFAMGHGPETEFSNPGVTLFALDAFRFTEHLNQHPALDTAVETLLDHWVVRKPIGPCHFGIGTLFMQIEYPFLRYNLFYYVYILSFYAAARSDPRFLDSLKHLEAKLDPGGRVVVERPNRQLARLSFCRKGEPSGPATRRYEEIAKNLQA